MVHQYTPVINNLSEKTISTTSSILTIGSCFSDNIGNLLRRHMWDTETNPVGIIYNPISIANSLSILQKGKTVSTTNFETNGEVHFHYDFHSQLSGLSQKELSNNIKTAVSRGNSAIIKCDWLIITLGTAIVYELNKSKSIVANNHRMPADLFTKKLLSIDESVTELYKILEGYHDKNIIITVSPIRHTREGLVQNSRSKARLIEIAHSLCDTLSNTFYFPAYEILIDELRGYRYFQKDMIHPNDEAINIIWQRFIASYMDDASKQKINDIAAYQRSVSHKPQFEKSNAHQSFLRNLEHTKQSLLIKYPEIKSL